VSLLSSLQKAKKDKRNSSGWAVKATTVAIVLGVILVGAYVFKAYFASKQLAKLLHEKDVLKEQKHIKKAEAKIQLVEADRKKVRAEIVEIDKKITELDKESEDARKYREDSLDLISKIKDWDDVEDLVDYSG
jgi:peptidoglycan hydrolase CwlO-like protein